METDASEHLSSLGSFIRQLADSAPRRLKFREDRPFPDWRNTLEIRFRERLGEFPAMPADLQPRLLERTACMGYVRERIEITTFDGVRMPIYLLIPDLPGKVEPLPVVLAIHGHGYGSREIVGLNPDGTPRRQEPGLHKDFAVSLVHQGLIVAAPELLGFGDRRLPEDLVAAAEDPGRNSCFRLSSALLLVGQSMAGYRIQETLRVLDYLRTRQEADSGRVGIMGISGGGLVAGFAAALDARIACAVVSGYTNTFADSILSRSHCLDNYIPGILSDAEMPDLLGLIAPRSLFIESGIHDPLFGPEGVKRAVTKLKRIFAAAGRPDGMEVDFFEGGHEIHGDPAFAWLKRQLIPTL